MKITPQEVFDELENFLNKINAMFEVSSKGKVSSILKLMLMKKASELGVNALPIDDKKIKTAEKIINDFLNNCNIEVKKNKMETKKWKQIEN